MANNVFQVKRTTVSGRTPNTTGSYATNSQYIAAGEFALNMADGILYSSNGSAFIEVGANNTNARVSGTLTVSNVTSNSDIILNVNGVANAIVLRDAFNGQIKLGSNVTLGGTGDGAGVFIGTQGSFRSSELLVSDGTGKNAALQPNRLLLTSATNKYIDIVVPSTVTNYTLTLPNTSGSNGQVLTTNGTGGLTWSTVTSGGVNTAASYTWTNVQIFTANVTVNGAIIAGGNSGTAGQLLASNGTGNVYWTDAPVSNAVYMKGGAATIGTLAAGGTNLFRVNANTLNYNTTIATGENAQATGPISVASGITLTVETGARVAIV